ncbi:hypothetical protein FEM03_17830 [Phragmitibacter flavus]|uniref:Uncharacterized protein n=1 Tax=Phragmitibacter flavus TaxID=2576071 RepID=A0A5R8KB63_9BACT|nr:circularly permuted type 2 ATP-grasp protein [Phragmitibacter flavus]TLD69497.1 hypothetical protein FEM03_17830 [Phragmitibacter flavus]
MMQPPPANVSVAALLAACRATGSGFDEARGADGLPRASWKGFLEGLAQMEVSDLAVRQEEASRLLREHGATYTIYDDPQAADRHWKLDILPLVIGAKEWDWLEKALKQRSKLLRMIVRDLYGPRRLLKEGWVPPGMLFANPGFLRAAHGIEPAGGMSLFHHAVDIARDSSGRWRVLADRTQAPSGKGYALENRVVLTSLFPDEFRDLNVERLAGFFQIERDSLRSLAPQNKHDPLVVLMTPGPLNETYFEHAYKARYLGFTLVEGADLTVRDRKVFLKTLEGLRQVDVILRRVDDTFCDPLELRSETWLGVAGLMEAWRAGNVAIANGVGTGVVETTAMLPFLPGLCRHLLAQDLTLPNAETWWCGQQKVLQQVEANLERYVIKRAFLSGAGRPEFGAKLSGARRDELLSRMRAFPHEYAAQELLNLSTAPVFYGGRLEQRPLVLRCYIVPNGDDLAVMPGGLTRVSPSPQGMVVSMQNGGVSKDTWVLSDSPVEQLTLMLPPVVSMRSEKNAGEVPSRVADHYYWLGRYAERLEGFVRLLRAVVQRLAGEGNEDQTRELEAMVPWMVGLGYLPDRFGSGPVGKALLARLAVLILSRKKDGGVRDLLGRLRYNAFALRDRISDDTWRLCNQLEQDSQPRSQRFSVPEALLMLNKLVLDLAAFSGMEMENMTRGHGWRFLDLGRRVERADNLMSWVKAAVHPGPRNEAVLGPLLEICDSAMTFRRRYHTRPQLAPILDLLIADETNPRSLMWQLQQMSRHASQLPRDGQEGNIGDEKRQVDGMLSIIASTHFPALAQAEDREPGNLLSLCEHMSTSLSNFSRSVTQHYFAHALSRVR